jgi:hypothetical protein
VIKLGTDHREAGEANQRVLEWVCLHELAHLVTVPRATDEARKTNNHDHPWRMNYLLLVRKMLGRRAAKYLRDAFELQGLPVQGAVDFAYGQQKQQAGDKADVAVGEVPHQV